MRTRGLPEPIHGQLRRADAIRLAARAARGETLAP